MRQPAWRFQAIAAAYSMNDSAFDTLVTDFYRAATGAVSWDQALTGVQQAFRARAAVLHTLDFADGRLLSLHGGGPNLDEAVFTYIRDFHQIDPRRHRALAQGPAAFGQWMHDHEAFDEQFVSRDRFFQHYLPAFDTRYNANVVLPVAGTVGTAFILELPAHRGPLDADEREMARRLGVHVQEALQAHQRVRSLMTQALAGHGLLNAFPYPMWLIDVDRHVAYDNPAAVRQAEGELHVRLRARHLRLLHPRADRLLTERLHGLCSQAHGSSTAVDLRRTSADPPVWLHLSLLQPGPVLGAFGDIALVLATLFDPGQVSSLDPFALAQLFELTPTEAKVAVGLADGQSAAQIGAQHGTTEATVRTHIRQVLHKVGAQRTVDVVRILRQGQALWAGTPAARRTLVSP